MKVLLVVNAAASSVTARTRVVIQKALGADHEVTLAETSRRGHASRLARGAATTGTEVVVVLGGDGTLNEAANGLAGTDCALAPLPGGSTNVFARTLGMPNDPIESVGVLLEALERESIEPIGLGAVNGRYFLFHAGFGFDAAVVDRVEQRSTLKRWAGHPLFAWSAITTWLHHFDRDHPCFSVELPDGEGIDDGYFSVVLNTDPYTYLGNRRLHLTDQAGLDRPLALVTLRSLSFATVTTVLGSAIGSGRALGRLAAVDRRHDLTSFRIVGHRPVPYQVDGDYLGETDVLDVRHEPGALRLVMPR